MNIILKVDKEVNRPGHEKDINVMRKHFFLPGWVRIDSTLTPETKW